MVTMCDHSQIGMNQPPIIYTESESKYFIDESIPSRVTYQSKHPQSVMHFQFYNQISMIRLLFIANNQTQLPNTPKII